MKSLLMERKTKKKEREKRKRERKIERSFFSMSVLGVCGSLLFCL